jgi:AraC-like DNA-binding protein
VVLSGFSFFRPHPKVADIIEAIWDIDLPDASSAKAIAFKVLPAVSPTLCVHYRAPAGSDQRVNPGSCRQRVTGVQTGAITVRPTGSMGAVIVHLKPEAACRVMGGDMDEFTDANIGLSDLFSPTEVALLEEMLGEAADAVQRAERIQAFLLARMRGEAPDTLVERAVLQLCRYPNWSVPRLAATLDISERQLSRRFHAMVGTNLKQFARVVRIGKAIAARRRGWSWVDIAYACGFSDQAHLIHEFKFMTGDPPEALFRTAATAEHGGFNASLAASGFYNTFVT